MSLLEEVLAAFTGNQVNVNDLPKGDPAIALGRVCAELFTDGVGTLRSIVPNERVAALSAVIWDLLGNKQVNIALGPPVSSLGFTVMEREGVWQALILIPHTWPKMVGADIFMQLGAILYTGVQAVDFYNDRLLRDPTGPARWHAYEAELLHTLQQKLKDWTPNEYQRTVMAKYPNGLDSPGVTLYPFKGYEPAKGSA